MSILTGQNHTVVAEYGTPQAFEAAAQAHQKVLFAGNDVRAVYSCSLKGRPADTLKSGAAAHGLHNLPGAIGAGTR